MTKVSTYFADPFRLSPEKVDAQKRSVELHAFALSFLEAIPHPCFIINEWRQILAANRRLEDWLGGADIETVIGMRPGEAIGCARASDAPAGCGTAAGCAFCGAANAVIECQRERRPVERECRITTTDGDDWRCLDLKVSASPIELGLGFGTTLVTITDISHEKRRRALEHVFLHDIANTAGALGGLLKMAGRQGSERDEREFIERAKRLAMHLNAEIHAHRDLLAAETNELKVALSSVDSKEILAEAAESVEAGVCCGAGRLELDLDSASCSFETDRTLLRRVLINLIKNALEASGSVQPVCFGCSVDESNVRFWIRNHGVMPPEVQLQVFQRAFTTKGSGRGLGTYSVRLLVEKYLEGKVSFVSAVSTGTVFTISLPARLKQQNC